MTTIEILIWLFLSFLSFIVASYFRQESPNFIEISKSALEIFTIFQVVKYLFVLPRLSDALEGEAMYMALFGPIAVLCLAFIGLSRYFGLWKDHTEQPISDGLREQISNLVENNSSFNNQSRKNKAIDDIAKIIKGEEIGTIKLFKSFNGAFKKHRVANHLKKGDSLAKNLPKEGNRNKQLEKAEKEYHKSTKIDPNNHVAWNKLGVVREWLGKYNESLEAYNKATKLKSDFFLAWYNQSVAMEKLKSYEQEIACCENALKYCNNFVSSPSSKNGSKCQEMYPSILINKGYALVKLEKYSQALDCFEQALQSKMNHANAYYNLAYLYAKQANFKLAREKLQKAFTFDRSYQESLKKDSDFNEFKDPESSQFNQGFCDFLDQYTI